MSVKVKIKEGTVALGEFVAGEVYEATKIDDVDTYLVRQGDVEWSFDADEVTVIDEEEAPDSLFTEYVDALQDEDTWATFGEQPALNYDDLKNGGYSITLYPVGEDPRTSSSGIDVTNYIKDGDFSIAPDEGAGWSSGNADDEFYDHVAEDEAVSEPPHYKAGMPEGIEVRDIIKAQGFWAEFCAGNVIKYSLRWQYKNGVEDLKKMVQYAQWLIEEKESDDV